MYSSEIEHEIQKQNLEDKEYCSKKKTLCRTDFRPPSACNKRMASPIEGSGQSKSAKGEQNASGNHNTILNQ